MNINWDDEKSIGVAILEHGEAEVSLALATKNLQEIVKLRRTQVKLIITCIVLGISLVTFFLTLLIFR